MIKSGRIHIYINIICSTEAYRITVGILRRVAVWNAKIRLSRYLP